MAPPRPSRPTPEALPELSDYVVRAIADWLHGREPSQRVPVKTAAVLCLICELYLTDRPFPTRAAVIKALGVTESLIDIVLSQRAAEGLIYVVLKSEMGQVKKRASVVNRRYVIPTHELLTVYRAATKRDKMERTRMRRQSVNSAAILAAWMGVTGVDPHICWDWLLRLPCHNGLL